MNKQRLPSGDTNPLVTTPPDVEAPPPPSVPPGRTRSTRMAATSETAPLRPVSTRNYTRRNHRAGSLWTEFWRVVLQPGEFFEHLPLIQPSRHWVGIAVLCLLLAGFSAVQYEGLQGDTPNDTSTVDGGMGGEGEMPPGTFDPFGGGGGGAGVGGVPVDAGTPGGEVSADGSGATDEESATDWTIGLVAAATLVLWWLALTLLLCEVTLLNGKRPNLGLNLQVAIWSSIPIGVMAAVQIVYYLTSKSADGYPGLAGFLLEWEDFSQQSDIVQKLLWSLASYTTIFWLWSLALLYIAGRRALHGRRLAVVLVVVLWVLLLVVAPVALGTLEMPEDAETTIEMLPDELSPGEFDPAGGFDPSGGFPPAEEVPAPGMGDGSGEIPGGAPVEDAPGIEERPAPADENSGDAGGDQSSGGGNEASPVVPPRKG